jgi:3-methyladenine DNA glycosylase AlkC
MAEQLKHILDDAAVNWLAESVISVYPQFQRNEFVAACLSKLDALELMPRGEHIADQLQHFLPTYFPDAAGILSSLLGDEIAPTGENGISVFRLLPLATYVKKYGLMHFEVAMDFQYALTKRFTAEFSIRPYIERFPQQTYDRLMSWAKDDNAHIRRLVSEGTRPRLPWAPRLRDFQNDPAPVLALLELLKDDSARYVQRSVANNLNDIGKDHPDILIGVCRRWLQDAPVGRVWIVNHALRSLVKAGNAEALALLGYGQAPQIAIGNITGEGYIVRVGETLRFSCDITNRSADRQELLVDFIVHFVKSSGRTSPKVFKLKKVDLLPDQSTRLNASVSFREMTTRKHFAGTHRIDLLVNGIEFPLLSCMVIE